MPETIHVKDARNKALLLIHKNLPHGIREDDLAPKDSANLYVRFERAWGVKATLEVTFDLADDEGMAVPRVKLNLPGTTHDLASLTAFNALVTELTGLAGLIQTVLNEHEITFRDVPA